MIEECSGISLDETSLLLQMGETKSLEDLCHTPMTRFAAYSLHPAKNGTVKRMKKPEIESEISFVSWKVTPGQTMTMSKSMRESCVLFVITNSDMETLRRDFDTLNSQDYVVFT